MSMWPWSKPKEETVQRDWTKELVEKHPEAVNDPCFIAQATLDTLLPHSKNPMPFSTYEIIHFVTQWTSEMSEEDRQALWLILERNPGKRQFNGSKCN